MKKIIFLILIVGQFIASFAQDLNYLNANFSNVPPTNWTLTSDQAASGTTATWSKSGYALVQTDAVDQEEWLISPSFAITAANTYTISFDYLQTYTTYGTNDLSLYISFDNGVTWDPASANADLVWRKSTDGTSNPDYWNATGTLGITSPGSDCTGKIAFVFEKTVGDVNQAIDNIYIEENAVAYRSFDFESGLGTGPTAWTVLANQAGAGSTNTWHNVEITKVEDDAALAQFESLFTNTFLIDDNALATVNLSVSFFSFMNDFSQGCRIYIYPAGQDSVLIGDLDYSGNSTRVLSLSTINLDAYKGENVRLELRFSNSAGTDADIFINSFSVDQDFDESSIEADANITLQPYESVIYPANAKYNADVAEGFWQVAPHSWNQNAGNTNVSWYRYDEPLPLDIGDHDHFARMDTVGADQGALNETMSSEVIALTYPAVGADYVLSFDWRTETNLNAGPDTDPNLGPNADYDFADIVVQIKVGAGDWITVWQEDDQDLLEATTSTIGTDYYRGWTGYQDYLDYEDNYWYHAQIDISQYITTSANVQIQVNYTGDGQEAGTFDIDNIALIQTQNPDFEIETVVPYSVSDDYYIEYTQLPYSQLDSAVNLGALITNYGITSFTASNMVVDVDADAVNSVYGYRVIAPAAFASPWPDTKLLNANVLAHAYSNGYPVNEGVKYKINANVTLNGNPPLIDDVTFNVTSTTMKRASTIFSGTVGDDGISGGRGAIFEVKKTDKIDVVQFYVSGCNYGSQTYLSVIKMTNPNATTGTLVYTSPRVTLDNPRWYTFDNDFKLTPGFYAFMINQTDANDLVLSTDDYPKPGVIRGNATNLYYNQAEVGNLQMVIDFVPNLAPKIVTEFPNDKVVVPANEAVALTIKAIDENEDPISWDNDVYPSWLSSWMTFTDNGDGTYTITGTPTDTDLGVIDITVSANDGKNADDSYPFKLEVVSELAYFTPDYYEPFNNSGMPYGWTVKETDKNGSDFNWRSDWGYVYINGDYNWTGSTENCDQDEWLISPPIYLEGSKAIGKNYTLEFDWYLGSFENFCGGNPDVLGSKDNVNGTANLADVTLLISTDNGITWSAPIWKEDDPELVSSTTDGILGGQNWGYDSWEYYTSVIKLDEYVGQKILIALRYQSKFATQWDNYFEIDELRVLMNAETNVWVYAETDYTAIPDHQINKTKGIEVRAYVVNEGQKIPEGAKVSVSNQVIGQFDQFDLNDTLFENTDTLMLDIANYMPDTAAYESSDYIVIANVDNNTPTGSVNTTLNVYRSSNYFKKDYGTSYSDKTFGLNDGIGTIYQLNDIDELQYIYVIFGNDMVGWGIPFSVTIIKLNSLDATDGEVIATIDDSYGTALMAYDDWSTNVYITNDKDYDKNLVLEPGIYAVMVNQLDADYNLSLYRSDRDYDAVGFIRGNYNELYNEPDDKGYLAMEIHMVDNDAPYFTTKSIEDQTIYQGEDFERLIETVEDNVWGDRFINVELLPSWMSFIDNGDGTGELSGNPNNAIPGTYNVSISVNDRYETTYENFIITVEQNPAPEFTTTPPAYAIEGVAFTYVAEAIDILGEDVTIEADTLVLPNWLDASFDAATNELTLTGTPDSVGNNVIKLIATDESGMVGHQTFNLFVVANKAPKFVSIPDSMLIVGNPYVYYVVTSDENNNETLTLTGTNLPAWLSLTDNGDGTAVLAGTPTAAGIDTVSITVTDAAGETAVQTYRTLIAAANVAPAFTSTAVVTVNEDQLYQYNIVATDADGDYLSLSAPTLPNFLVFTVKGNGMATLKGIPTQKYVGLENKVIIEVTDGMALVKQEFNITVTGVNDAPEFKSEVVTDAEVGKYYSYVVEAIDEEGNALMFNANLPAWLTITDQFDGTALVSGTPNEENLGNNSIQIFVSDGSLSAEQQYDLNVTEATDVNESDATQVALYPNPSDGKFKLLNGDGAQVSIYSAAGQLIEQIENYSNNQLIDMSGYRSGSYLVKITNASYTVTLPMNIIK